jgi:hypothetical protein
MNLLTLQMVSFYDSITEGYMRLFYDNLSEKDKRHYAAVEALKLGHGGITYVSNLFDISVKTIQRGIDELQKKV